MKKILKAQNSKILKKMETVTSFIFLGSKITLDDDCSYKLKDAYSFEEKLLFSC